MPAPLGVLRGRGGGDFGFGSGFTILVLDRAKIAAFNLPGGMTYRWVNGIGREIATVAESKLYPGHGYRTGDLRRSVGHSVTPVGEGVVTNVRATSAHALYYHEGTRAHLIKPNPPKKFLAWNDLSFSPGIGGYSITELGGRHLAREVHHPGFAGRPFLRDAMEEVLAFHGIA